MNYFYTVCFAALIMMQPFALRSQHLGTLQTTPSAASILNDPKLLLTPSSQGRDFWLAVPLNDDRSQPRVLLDFYVTSYFDCTVTLEIPGDGFIRTKKLAANTVITFSSQDKSASFDWEIAASEVILNSGVHIYSDYPISVYMLNKKEVTSDGYLALPYLSLGTDYIHCSYYDCNEYRGWAGGFVIVATEDKTNVSITLKGKGAANAKTKGGAKIGDVLSFILDKGQVFEVAGDGLTRGKFDLTGTSVHANKPISMISYHERTLIPSNNSGGRDHIIEMLRPVTAWGKTHITQEYTRDNKGDFYRLIASEDNTAWSMKYYDKTSGLLIGQRSGKLAKAGDFFEDYNNWNGVIGAIEGFRGVSVWTSDKPSMLMQYMYSQNWDNGTQFDPGMLMITPVEQFTSSALIQAPSDPDFVINWYHYIIEGDPSDSTNAKLKSLVIDGEVIYNLYPQLLSNRVANTNYYWGKKALTPGKHRVSCASKIGGYVYGFANNNVYSWPASTGTRVLTPNDTMPPVLTRESTDKKRILFHVTEENVSADSTQVDAGIYDIMILPDSSYNYDVNFLTSDHIMPLPKTTVFDVSLTPHDSTKDARAIIAALDRAGNYTFDTVSYHAKEVLTPVVQFAGHIRFGNVAIGDTKDTVISASITNIGISPLIVTDTKLESTVFSILSGGGAFTVEAGASHSILMRFKPVAEGNENAALVFTHNSVKSPMSIPVTGTGINSSVPIIEAVAGLNFGAVNQGKVKDSVFNAAVKNTGTAQLTITSVNITGPDSAQFLLQSGSGSSTLNPNQEIAISLRFTPQRIGISNAYLRILHNATNSPTLIPITGEGIPPTAVEESSELTGWEISSTENSIIVHCGCANAQEATLMLYDNLGRVVMNVPTGNAPLGFILSTSQLTTGMYIVRVQLNGNVYSKPLIVW